MNSLRSTSGKSFISAEWNRGMHVYSAGFRTDSGHNWKAGRKHTFSSALEPGRDGNCLAIVYFRDQQPSWNMFPCNKEVSAFWICKSQPKTHSVLQRPDYPSRTCNVQSLLIKDTCYEYQSVPGFKNASVVLGVPKSYLQYLEQVFSNHHIDVAFVRGCSIMKTPTKCLQGDFIFANDDRKFEMRWTNIYQLTEAENVISVCGPTMQQCHDGSCRAQSIICQLDFECAPNLCACMVGGHIDNSTEYCRHQCPPGTCRCAPLMFQCSTGGCIPYSHVCDNVYDCADISDEFCISMIANRLGLHYVSCTTGDLRVPSDKSTQLCFDLICISGTCIDVQLVNDLIPDCVDADDEYHSLSIKYDGLYFRCKNAQDIPCFPGHSKCFGINKLCLYDRDNFDHISYCRDGAHLRNCRRIQCTNTFKCPRSYCIPLRKICDGIYDCYNGEDEKNCHNNLCSGYLKCREVEFCVHPVEVCDGYCHCPHGDDEELCDIVGCPPGCTCLGYSVWCRDKRFTYIPEFRFYDIKHLSVGSNYTFFPTFANLSLLSTLVTLDLSRSIIFNICPAFQTDYNFYRSLHVLYLQHNNIEYLSPACFAKLLTILVISLQGNPLISIADDAFRGVALYVLIIRNTRLTSLSNQWISRIEGLKILDKRGVKVTDFRKTTAYSLTRLEMVYTDDVRLCCVLNNVHGCHDDTRSPVRCRLLSHSNVGPVLILIATAISVFIIISLWCVFKLFANSRPSQFLIHSSILLNRLLCVCFLISIAIIDVIHGEHYIFWYTSLSSRLVCQSLSVILCCGMVMSNLSTSLVDYITQMAVTGMLSIQGSIYSRVKIFLFSSHFLVITGFTLLIFGTQDFLKHQVSTNQLCNTPLGVSLADHKWLGIGPVIIAITILLSFIYSVFSNSVICVQVYASGKRVQSMASTEIDIHKTRMFKLLKTLSYSIVFRSLECLLTVCIIFSKVCDRDINLETQLMAIITSLSFGCFGNTIPSVWYLMLGQKRRSAI